ncbi:prepilin-type N-terminal cleavage/methylation domain-containing protein [bacterium]|nr:prepilin-type N-terminal cleavage/methylation domain-containing protein [bacterium]
MKNKLHNNKKAFTLIEILIVIAIIGILVSVIMVSLNVARNKARVAEFQSTASSMNTALVTECNRDTPAPGGIAWPAGNVSGAITAGDPLTCANGEVSGGSVTMTAAYGTCVGSMTQNGVVFIGGDC